MRRRPCSRTATLEAENKAAKADLDQIKEESAALRHRLDSFKRQKMQQEQQQQREQQEELHALEKRKTNAELQREQTIPFLQPNKSVDTISDVIDEETPLDGANHTANTVMTSTRTANGSDCGNTSGTKPLEVVEEDHGQEKDDDEKDTLSENTFSFLISAKFGSIPFMTGIAIFLLKNVIFSLVVVNLLDITKVFNKLGIPVSVESAVMASQFLAFIISVFTQNDLLDALIHLFRGYSTDIRDTYGRNGSGGGSMVQWLFSLLCSFADGLFGLSATFMLIVTSATVLDVLLNFAAVEFVAGLDEAAFFLAKSGFIGKKNKEEAILVKDTEFKVPRGNRKNFKARAQATGLVIVLLIVMILWTGIHIFQSYGRYNAQTIVVQFDDKVRPILGAHSGYYSLHTRPGNNPTSRFRYIEDRKGGGRFEYCLQRREWRFLYNETADPCNDEYAIVKSEKTQSFDMVSLSQETWYVQRTDTKHFIPMPDFILEVGCERNEECGGKDLGHCVANKCQCVGDRYGLRCKYDPSNTCDAVELDERFEANFPSIRQLATSYKTLPNTPKVYERPIYFNNSTKDVIMFTGVRWAITNLDNTCGNDGNQIWTVDELVRLDENSTFHAETIPCIDMVSFPVPYQTFEDRTSSPTDLEWETIPNRAGLSDIDLVQTPNPVILLCSICENKTNPCSYGNTCTATRECHCTDRSSGPLCHIDPASDGKCDIDFNIPEFDYDGGDCCEATCTSSSSHVCGELKAPSGFKVSIGHPYCTDPNVTDVCKGTIPPCYIKNSDPIPSIGFDEAVVEISGNGKTLVVT